MWLTFPLIPIAELATLDNPKGQCACGPKCPNAGKHPAVAWRALEAPTSIPPGHGVGLATGRRSGVFVVDLDVKGAKDGIAALEALGDVPPTLAARTGSGGLHLYFQWPGHEVRNSAGKLGPGIDIRGDGGYVVQPPSAHVSGRQYEWLNWGTPVAPAPAWLLTALEGRAPALSLPVRHDQLVKLVQSWKRKSKPLADVLEAVAAGEPFAPPGQRDTVLFQLCADIAKDRPHWEPDSVAALFRPSLSRCGDDLEKDLAKVAEKLRRLAERDSTNWSSRLDLSKEGKPLGTVANAILALRFHEEWTDRLAWDERRSIPLLDGERIHDGNVGNIAAWLGEKQKIQVSLSTTRDAIQTVAREHPEERFRAWLDGLTWDGTPRLDTWLVDYAGAENGPYVQAVAAAWVISAVARTFEPGCQVDVMLVLEGKQGVGKSSLLRALGGEWFADRIPHNLSDKDAALALQGPAIVEFQELEALRRNEVRRVKEFVSERYDEFRAPYAHTTTKHPRRVVFAGSTNRDQWIDDETGARRFWPVKCGACRPKDLPREQIWAEAVARFRDGEAWHLEGWKEALAVAEQERRQEVDAWEGGVENALVGGRKNANAFAW